MPHRARTGVPTALHSAVESVTESHRGPEKRLRHRGSKNRARWCAGAHSASSNAPDMPSEVDELTTAAHIRTAAMQPGRGSTDLTMQTIISAHSC